MANFKKQVDSDSWHLDIDRFSDQLRIGTSAPDERVLTARLDF